MRQVIGGDINFEGGNLVTPECDRKQQRLRINGAFRTMIRLWDISYHNPCGVFNDKKNNALMQPRQTRVEINLPETDIVSVLMVAVKCLFSRIVA